MWSFHRQCHPDRGYPLHSNRADRSVMWSKQRFNDGNMRPSGVKLLTPASFPWLNRAALPGNQFMFADGRLPAEEKEFLLTPGGQTVMNIFTASGSVCNFVFKPRERRRH